MSAPNDSKPAQAPKDSKPVEVPSLSDAEVEAKLRTLSRRGFAIAGAAVAGTLLAWRWVLRWEP